MMKAIKLTARADIRGMVTDEDLKVLDGYGESEWKVCETDGEGIVSFDTIDAFVDKFFDKNPQMKNCKITITEKEI